MKNEDDIYKEVQEYINGKKHNRPCTLSTIKRKFRIPKIIDLIFSNPDIFNLEKEFEHVPPEYRSENITLQLILENPKRISLLTEEEQTLPVLIAFEISKRRYELGSSIMWREWREKIGYSGKSEEYRTHISDICDNILTTIEEGKFEINEIINVIKEYCNSNNIELQHEEKQERRYPIVDFDIDKKLMILISGLPDAGKTTFSRVLAGSIRNSICFDSDILYKNGLIHEPLSSLIKDKHKVVIFSDIYAEGFFTAGELWNMDVINILMKPKSIQEMHRNSKYMRHIPFEEYKANEIEKYNFDGIENPIIVENDYTPKMNKEIDRTIEEIAKRLGLDLVQKQDEYIATTRSKGFKERLQYVPNIEQQIDINKKIQNMSDNYKEVKKPTDIRSK